MAAGDPTIYDDLLRFKPDGVSLNRWAMLAGVSRTVWNDMRRHGNPARRTLDKLLAAAGSSIAEFEALRVGGTLAPRGASLAGLADKGAQPWRGAPLPPLAVHSSKAAGEWGRPGGGIEQVRIGAPLPGQHTHRPPSIAADRAAYAIAVVGDSMWPRFRPGRRLVISPAAPVAIGDDVVVRLRGRDGLALVKELVRRSAGEIELRQFNPECTFTVSASDIQSIEKVVGEAI